MSQDCALDMELAARVLQVKEEEVAGIRAVGDGSAIDTESEIGVIPGERSPGRQAEGLGGTYPQATRLRVRRDRPPLQPDAFAVRDQALALRVEVDGHGPTERQGGE